MRPNIHGCSAPFVFVNQKRTFLHMQRSWSRRQAPVSLSAEEPPFWRRLKTATHRLLAVTLQRLQLLHLANVQPSECSMGTDAMMRSDLSPLHLTLADLHFTVCRAGLLPAEACRIGADPSNRAEPHSVTSTALSIRAFVSLCRFSRRSVELSKYLLFVDCFKPSSTKLAWISSEGSNGIMP